MKVVEIKPEEFNRLVQDLIKCKEEKKELQKAVDYLNKEIKEYNDRFSKDENEN